MSAIQEIFRTFGPAYLERYGDRMPKVHKKVKRAIQNCRNGTYGTAVYRCDQCGSSHTLACSCGNRHCPTCQHDKAENWLHTQQQKLLPCHYFLLTVTVPKALQRVIRSHQRDGYAALFSCTVAALKKLARDPRFLGSQRIGCLAVLHTWGSQLQYHPHLHLVVPGGAITPDDSGWLTARQDLFVHTKPLARIIRAKFRDAMKAAGLLEEIDPPSGRRSGSSTANPWGVENTLCATWRVTSSGWRSPTTGSSTSIIGPSPSVTRTPKPARGAR